MHNIFRMLCKKRSDLSDNRLNFLKTMIKILEFSILFAPRIPENIIVYRTVDDNFMDAINKVDLDSGGCAEECGFLSTSLLSKYLIENNYGHLLRISALGVDLMDEEIIEGYIDSCLQAQKHIK